MNHAPQHLIALAIVIGSLLASPRVFATDYYVDSNGGSDSNSGLSTSAAWQSLTKVNAKIFLPGDRLLFKSTCTWIGSLNPKGSGAAGNPIVIDRYGTGTKPIIHGNGANGPGATGGGAVYLYNQEYWEINNLEITNYDLAAGYASTPDGERRGIHIAAADFGTVDHVYIRNCYIHHIRGTLSATDGDLVAKRTGGIIVETISDSITPTRFTDVLIESNTVTTVRNEGIVAAGNRSGQNDFPGTSAWLARKVTNLMIRGNTISDVSKNAMIIRLADATCLVEHNVCFNTATLDTGNTMFTASCDGVVFQFNEGYDNHGGPLGDHDGSMYDADLRSINIKFQYSYSHDNAHGLLWLYPSASGANANIICRYNISRADRGIIFAFSGDAGATASTYIYNNVIFTPANLSPIFFDHRSATHTYYVYNNIFYNESATASYSFGGSNVPTFDYNVFYGQHAAGEPSDAHKLTSNPLLVSPGSGGSGINSLSGYQLQPGSPCIDSGLAIANNGGRDFFGKSVPINSATDRGASEFLNPNNFISPRFASVTASSDIPYATVVQTTWSSGSTATVNLALDLYQPTGDTTMGRPVIMWLHGGGFRQSSDKTQSYIVDYCNEFAKRGYVCISIEYRRRFTDADGHADADVAGTPEYAALQDATRDARYALDWIRANAGTYRIDPNLIFIAGGSAGGAHLSNRQPVSWTRYQRFVLPRYGPHQRLEQGRPHRQRHIVGWTGSADAGMDLPLSHHGQREQHPSHAARPWHRGYHHRSPKQH